MPKAARSKPKRPSLATCRTRTTSKGTPYHCYATKQERCAALTQAGKHSIACSASRYSPLAPGSGRVGGYRRPVGNPIDPCVAVRSDFEAMTIPQIVSYIRKNTMDHPTGYPILDVNPSTGMRKVKADWINEALSLAQSCPASYPIDVNTATTRQLGLALKYKGIKPPTLGDPAVCGVLKGKKGKDGVWRSRPCKAQFKQMMDQAIARGVGAERVVTQQMPGGVVLSGTVAPPTILTQAAPTAPPPKPSEPVVKVTVKAPTVETPVRLVAVPVAATTTPVPVVQQQTETPKTLAFVPPETAPAAAVTVVKQFNPSERSEKIKFEVKTAEGAHFENDPYESINISTKDRSAVIIDSACVTEYQPKESLTSFRSIDIGVLFRACKRSVANDCNYILHVMPLGSSLTSQTVSDWKDVVQLYYNVSQYQKDIDVDLKDMLILPYEAAWICGSETSLDYHETRYGNKISTSPTYKGFLLVKIPPYVAPLGGSSLVKYATMSEYLLYLNKVYPNMSPDGMAFQVVEDIQKLAEKYRKIGYMPRNIDPVYVGYMIPIEETPEAAVKYPPTAIMNPNPRSYLPVSEVPPPGYDANVITTYVNDLMAHTINLFKIPK